MTKRTRKEALGEFAARVLAAEDNRLTEQYIQAMGMKSTEIAGEAQVKKDFVLPDAYKDYADVFNKKEFDTRPERRPWDHEIPL